MKIQHLFNSPILKKNEIIEIFKEIDEKLNRILKLINANTEFLNPEFLRFYMLVANGDARFRNLFIKEDRNRKNLKSKMRGGFTPDDKRFLMKNFFILQSLHNKEINVLNNKFNRYVKHEIIEKFLQASLSYENLCENVTRQNYEFLNELNSVEEKLLLKNDGLYGLIRMVREEYDSFLKLRDRVISPYLRYVYTLAAKYSQHNEQKEENFQVGCTGLFKAILMYDFNHSSFGNYVKFWIRQAIMDGIYNSCLIKIPNYNWQQYAKLEKLRSNTKNLKDLIKKANVSEDQFKSVYERVSLSQVQSLDNILEEDENSEMLAIEQTEKIELTCLDSLNEEELFIIALIYAQYHLIDNNINEDQIKSERLRQLKTVN